MKLELSGRNESWNAAVVHRYPDVKVLIGIFQERNLDLVILASEFDLINPLLRQVDRDFVV
jgi:hypothetical protein